VKFGDAADKLNHALEDAEGFLLDLDVNVRAEVPLSTGKLAFGKSPGGAWGLFYVHRDGHEQPITSANIRARIEAAGKLHELRAALIDGDKKTLADINAAINDAQTFARQAANEKEKPTKGTP
jgi:hypothetical protein